MGSSIKTPYRPDIDGLRAIAVLSVMTYHLNSSWLPGGYVGVDVFFVISGFVVASSLAGSQAGSFSAFLSEFYARRLARILPALVSVLIFSALMATLFIPNAWLSELSERTAKYAFFGLSNLVMQGNADTYFAPRAEFNPYTHTWSLSVEEQYYVLAPMFVYFWLRAYRRDQVARARTAIGVLGLIMVSSLVACIWASQSQPTAAFYSIVSRLWELAAGALLFLLTCGRQDSASPFFSGSWMAQRQARLQAVTAWLGLILVATGFIYAEATSFPWPWALLPVGGTLLLIGGAVTGTGDAVRRTLAAPVPVWIGKRSYSLYLWHWPVFVMMRWTAGLNTVLLFTIAVTTTFVFATLSYRMIEKPLRHNAWMEGRAKWVRITVFMLMPVIGLVLATHLFTHPWRYSQSSVVRSSLDWYAKGYMPYPDVGDRKCAVAIERHELAGGSEIRYVPHQCRDKSISKKMFVLGDSHAGMLAALFEQLAAEEGIQVSLFSYPGCSYINLSTPMDAAHQSVGCLEFTRSIVEQTIHAANPGDIVILSSLRMQRYGDHWASFNLPDMYDFMYSPQAMKSRQAALEDAQKWLQPFAEKELKVVFTAPTPVFKAPPFRCSDWFNSMNPICIGHNQQNRSELEKLRQPIVDSMKTIGQTFDNVSVWDAFPLLCPDETCRTQKDGRPLFFDGDHLSAYAILLIYPEFKKTIMALK